MASVSFAQFFWPSLRSFCFWTFCLLFRRSAVSMRIFDSRCPWNLAFLCNLTVAVAVLPQNICQSFCLFCNSFSVHHVCSSITGDCARSLLCHFLRARCCSWRSNIVLIFLIQKYRLSLFGNVSGRCYFQHLTYIFVSEYSIFDDIHIIFSPTTLPLYRLYYFGRIYLHYHTLSHSTIIVCLSLDL